MDRQKLVAAAISSSLLIGGGVALMVDQQKDRAIGGPVSTFGQQAPILGVGVGVKVCSSVPGKAWGSYSTTTTTKLGSGTVVYTQTVRPWWHYGPAIKKPTRIETVCLTVLASGGSVGKVTYKTVQ